MRSAPPSPVIQFVVSLATGFSAPQNVDAVRVLAQGWINDMYAGTVYDPSQRTGYYGDPGTTIDIPTAAGMARAYVLPAPTARPDLLYPFYLILRSLLLAANLDFATCAVPPQNPLTTDLAVSAQPATTASCAGSVTGE